MKTVMVLSNHPAYTYHFRKEIIQALMDLSYQIVVVVPPGSKLSLLEDMGCHCIAFPYQNHGTNPFHELALLGRYYSVISQSKPDLVLSYTIKPNLYGGLICRLLGIPWLANITGLGPASTSSLLFRKAIHLLYRLSCSKANCVFFQNSDNQAYFYQHRIPLQRSRCIPGSGVNTQEFKLLQYPEDGEIQLVFISRIVKEKGIDQYLAAAQYFHQMEMPITFHVVGNADPEYETVLKASHDQSIIQYHGFQENISPFYQLAHCVVHPTYYPEGMSNVLLEGASCGRPLITSNRSGSKEAVEEGVNGYLVEARNEQSLIQAILTFYLLPYAEKRAMGLASREKMIRQFDRELVISAYLEEIAMIQKKEFAYEL